MVEWKNKNFYKCIFHSLTIQFTIWGMHLKKLFLHVALPLTTTYNLQQLLYFIVADHMTLLHHIVATLISINFLMSPSKLPLKKER